MSTNIKKSVLLTELAALVVENKESAVLAEDEVTAPSLSKETGVSAALCYKFLKRRAEMGELFVSRRQGRLCVFKRVAT